MLLSTGQMYGSSHIPVWTSVIGPATNAGSTSGWSGFTVRLLFTTPSQRGGTQIRITARASASQGMITDVWRVGHAAAAGDAYDFEAGSPVPILWAGAAGLTLATSGSQVSDAANFTWAVGKNILITTHYSGGSSMRTFSPTLGGAVLYQKSANEATTENVAGYSTSTYGLVSDVELFI